MSVIGSLLAKLLFVLLGLHAAADPTLADSVRATQPMPAELASHYRELPFSATTASVHTLSPDESRLAYIVEERGTAQQPSEMNASNGALASVTGWRLWVTEISTGTTIKVGVVSGGDFGLSWSPDSQSLAFFSTRENRARPDLYIWKVKDGETSKVPITNLAEAQPFERVQWLADSQHIIVRVSGSQESMANPAFLVRGRFFSTSSDGITVYQSKRRDMNADFEAASDWAESSRRHRFCSLAQLDIQSGKQELLARDVYAEWFSLSPDAKQLAYLELQPAKPDDGGIPRFDLLVVSTAEGTTKKIAQNIYCHHWPRVVWSPTSELIALISTSHGTDSRCPQLLVISMREKATQFLRAGTSTCVGDRKNEPVPFWSLDGSELITYGQGSAYLWSIDNPANPKVIQVPGRQIYGVTSSEARVVAGLIAVHPYIDVVIQDLDSQTNGYSRFDLQTGRITELWHTPVGSSRGILTPLFVTRRGILQSREDTSNPPRIELLSNDYKSARTVAELNPEIENYPIGKSLLVKFNSPGGESLQEAVLLPADYQSEKRYPLVVWTRADKHPAEELNKFSPELALLTTRGFIVSIPDGAWRAKHIREGILETFVASVQRLVTMGLVDANRVGVWGHSFGAFTAASILSSSPVPRVGVVACGYYDWISSFYGIDASGNLHEVTNPSQTLAAGETLWDDIPANIANSPFFHANAISVPVLIVDGTNDELYPEGRNLFGALARLGGEATYVEYRQEGHVPYEWSGKHYEDYLQRSVEWFERYLGSVPETASRAPTSPRTGRDPKK